ncbi:MAG: 16S rRNA (uracil(1498)-N(3))-methyltransferase [Gammaproteobacteria bacterium 28-57-27]|nr:MAG: 16S rRNA (uracil(1498)-N(3))-methyltransferase [Gammaproteobacteria bacterium 28-57-27]
MKRFFINLPLVAHEAIDLPKEVRLYMERVLRLKPGHSITLFNGQGGQFNAEFQGNGRVQLLDFASIERESPLSIHLIQGISKGERMDVTLQKATELGASRISPVTTERSVVRLDEERAERRHERWNSILRSACEQCGRNHIPQLDDLQKLERVLSETRHADGCPDEGRIVLAPTGTHTLHEMAQPARLSVLIGPEGGLSDAEIELAIGNGFTPIRLGTRILRTETAGLAILAAVQTLWGDF